MGQIRFIEYGGQEYDRTLALRNKVMRIPLGLNIYREDFSFERECVILGMFEAGQLLGVGVMSNKEECYKVEYLCRLEKIAQAQGGEKIWMDARVSAERFYKHHGYQAVGEIFLLDYAPVAHIIMEKTL